MKSIEAQINSEGSNVQPPTLREWLLAVLLFPVTIQRLVVGINQLTEEMRYYRKIPQLLENLDEVGRDFNEGLYNLRGGKVSYERPGDNKNSPT